MDLTLTSLFLCALPAVRVGAAANEPDVVVYGGVPERFEHGTAGPAEF